MAFQFRESLKQLIVARQISIRTQWYQARTESTDFAIDDL
jgi:hypothetical protein